MEEWPGALLLNSEGIYPLLCKRLYRSSLLFLQNCPIKNSPEIWHSRCVVAASQFRSQMQTVYWISQTICLQISHMFSQYVGSSQIASTIVYLGMGYLFIDMRFNDVILQVNQTMMKSYISLLLKMLLKQCVFK